MWEQLGKTVRLAMRDSDKLMRFMLCVIVLTASVTVLMFVAAAVA
ncbi:hypothetical protein [Nocardia sp. NPDC003979]